MPSLETLTGRLPFFRGAAPVPETWLEIQSRADLAHMLAERLAPIRDDVGVGEEAWNSLYASLYLSYAEFVQALPASEAHHHRGAGGMLEHGIEVSAIAARACDRSLLPPAGGNGRRVSSNQQEQWAYAVVMASLLHDIGKVLVDMQIKLYDAKQGGLGLWLPLTGPMTRIAKASHYSVHYRPQRKYHLHEQCSQLLITHIAPPRGMFWLMSDLKLFSCFIAAVSGNLENAGVVGEIVRAADGASAAAAIGGDAQSPDPEASRPLHETLMLAIRELVLHGVKMNEPGAAGFVKDGQIYLVSKTILDEARRYLSGRGVSLPANPRLMDVLTDAKRLVTTAEGKAVWSRRIKVGEFDQVLTVLRVEEEKLLGGAFPGGDFEGLVEAADDAGGKPDAAAAEEGAPAPEPVKERKSAGAEDLPPPPGDIEPASAAADESEDEAVSKSDLGREFLDWLVAGIRAEDIPINTEKSRVHMVAGGAMFLVSPAIFKAYSRIDPEWQEVQRCFQRTGLCAKKDGADSNLYTFVVSNRGKKLTGYLIEDAANVLDLDNLPEPNAHLQDGGDERANAKSERPGQGA